ncbi:MAG: nucleotide sugar dehydrogenase [Vallitalea sp.]|jgi:UDPglucose 6-dehydrogenase|nr:nucleotide sugar dehydrogenase [Vallitalea sp.]
MKYVITVFGLGFVGITTGLGFAEMGNLVYGYDVDEKRILNIKNGVIPFMEPKLEEVLKKHLNNNFLIANNVRECVEKSDLIFICVGTPFSNNGSADLSYIYDVLDEILVEYEEKKNRVIVIKSTVPPSTTKKKFIPYINEKKTSITTNFTIANNPEFLREGKCWDDFISPDRIVCGVEDKGTETLLRQLYKNFEAPFFAVELNTAEFIKYLSNSLLATMISFSNEMSIAADLIGNINIKDSFKVLHMDKRWDSCNMKSYVYPGCGYGGYCLPKDTKALLYHMRNLGYEPEILKSVINMNEDMSKHAAKKIMTCVKKNNKIAILGLSFKPESDDVRESAASKIIDYLNFRGYSNISAYDPVATTRFKQFYNFDFVEYIQNMDEACRDAEIIVIVTAWKKFANLKTKYPTKKILDLRYFL